MELKRSAVQRQANAHLSIADVLKLAGASGFHRRPLPRSMALSIRPLLGTFFIFLLTAGAPFAREIAVGEAGSLSEADRQSVDGISLLTTKPIPRDARWG
jgi:hypothetical protein